MVMPIFLALERYSPDTGNTRTDKVMGRFPMRNRFISDYIFETTGKRRTPKQVGSRLQQLRDTCKKDESAYNVVLFLSSALTRICSPTLDISSTDT